MRAPATWSTSPATGPTSTTCPRRRARSTTLATLFTSIDLLRVSINPTGYWDDNVHLNPNAARPCQNTQTSYYYPLLRSGLAGSDVLLARATNTYGFQPATSCVRLPTCKDAGVAANKSEGVYTDGGKLHAFDTSTHFGIFIVRDDGRIYVPAAFQKSTSGYVSFGDNWGYGYRASATTHSATRIPQMTVSPDGRIGRVQAAHEHELQPDGDGGHDRHPAHQPDRRADRGLGRRGLQDHRVPARAARAPARASTCSRRASRSRTTTSTT